MKARLSACSMVLILWFVSSFLLSCGRPPTCKRSGLIPNTNHTVSYQDGTIITVKANSAGEIQYPTPITSGFTFSCDKQFVCVVGLDSPCPLKKPDPTPPPGCGNAGIASKVILRNCHVGRSSVHIWIRDLSTGEAFMQLGTASAQNASNGVCPSSLNGFSVSLVEGHIHEIVAVDPDAIGCGGRNDPSQVNCQRFRLVVCGNKNGQVKVLTIT